MYHGEAHRCVSMIELREKLRLDYQITNEGYRSEHSVSGVIRGVVNPDKGVVRDREYLPKNPLESLLQLAVDSDTVVGDGYPGTELMVALTRCPPRINTDEQYQEGFAEQAFSVEGVPKNGTISLNTDWDTETARQSLAEDEEKVVTHKYEIESFPSKQLPVIIRGKLYSDAREYLEGREVPFNGDPKMKEGQAVLSIEIEYKDSAPEVDQTTDERLIIENFRAEMESTFPGIEFVSNQNVTYNPDQQRAEWRQRDATPGERVQYEIIGRMNQLLGLGRISATLRGTITRDTLTGTEIEGVYDRAGGDLSHPSLPDIERQYGVTITGDIEIDPKAVRRESRKVASTTVQLNDTPFDAYDRVKTVCDREGMTIIESESPSDPEPVTGQEGVFQITNDENRDAGDTPGQLEVKREYGDRGIVYADIMVTGQFTPMSQDREVSQFSGQSDRAEDHIVRADKGGLEKRGKSTVDIKARSVSAELNAELLDAIESAIGGGRV